LAVVLDTSRAENDDPRAEASNLRGSATRDSGAMARLEDKVRATDRRGEGGRRRIGEAAPPPFSTRRWRGGMMTATMEAPSDNEDNDAFEGRHRARRLLLQRETSPARRGEQANHGRTPTTTRR
jgi:hypothetical protein